MTDAAQDKPPNVFVRAKDSATAIWTNYRDGHVWLQHVLTAYARMTRSNANQYAAAITYFSFLALFPLILLGVSIVGYVLFAQPDLQTKLFNNITNALPAGFGSTVKTALDTAIANRGSVGVIGLLGVLLTGLGWIGNLRQAIDAVWGHQAAKRNFITSRMANLLVLGGLGLGVVVSVGLTAVGTSLTTQILGLVGLDTLPGATSVLKVLGIAVAAGSDMVIFWWLLVRLPAVDIDHRTMLKGALMAALGFEVLKIVGTYTIAHASQAGATSGPFASIIAILVWIQLVSRFMLFCCAWMATVRDEGRTANSIPIIEPAPMVEVAETPGVSAATVGATLVGAGAVAGAVAAWAATRPRPPSRD